MKSRLITILVLLIFLQNSYASSQLKIICDKDNEEIYLNNSFKSSCDTNEVIRLMVKPGIYTIKITKKAKDVFYKYFKKIKIGNGVQKIIETNAKPIYNQYHYYIDALNSQKIDKCNLYLKKYPNGKYKKQIKHLKMFLSAKNDFKYVKVYKQKYSNDKYYQKLKRYYQKNPLINILRIHTDSVLALKLS